MDRRVIATMTPGRQRRAQRAVHLLAAVVLAAVVLCAYAYAPLGSRLEGVVRFAVLPALALTGIAMWQSARIRRALRSRRGREPEQTRERPKGQKGRWPYAPPRNG
jgi:peptidoglycan/LPS O-acetylase OafA/YrhL